MNNLSEASVKELIEELKTAASLYYQEGGESALTDDEFDAKVEYLKSVQDDYPEFFEDGSDGALLLEGEPGLGTKPATTKTVVHTPPMLSLAKAKVEDQLYSYLRKTREAGAESFDLQAKLDGFALAAEYVDGELVRLSKRGNGQQGDEITHMHTSKEIHIENLPDKLPVDDDVEIRGELFFTTPQYDNANENRVKAGLPPFKKSRNAVSGLASRIEGNIGYEVNMMFCAYGVYSNNKMVDITSVEDSYGLFSVNSLTSQMVDDEYSITELSTDEEVIESIEKFGETRKDEDWVPTDGVVVKPHNEAEMNEKMGSNGHHPFSQIAWKYKDESAQTTIEDIIITVGRVGRLTPVAKVKPVHLSGAVISSISLHNFSQVKQKGFRVGSVIQITRSNDVIPYAELLISNPKDSVEFEVPKDCPVCGKTLQVMNDYKTVKCTNLMCPARFSGNLLAATSKGCLDIDGMSNTLVSYLKEIGRVQTVADFFTLTEDELKDMPYTENSLGSPIKLGQARAKNIADHIEKAKTHPLQRLLVSLGIPTLGGSTAWALIEAFDTMDGIQNASVGDISQVPGIGAVKSQTIYDSLKAMSGIIEDMKTNGVEFNHGLPKDKVVNTDSSVSGFSFSISGSVPGDFANRGAFVEWLGDNGAEFHSSPKAETSYMIAEESGTTSKIKNAKKLGVPFLTASEFEEKFLS